MVATLAQAQRDFAPYEKRLRACVTRAIATYTLELGKFAYRHSKRSQASLIHDYMVDEIKTEFDGEAGITWSVRRNLFTVNFFHRYLVKLKKHDRRLHTRQITTQLVLDWLGQKQLELPGMPDEATNVHLGYQPGATLSASTVWMTCPDGSVLDWKWELQGEEPMQLPVPEGKPKPQPSRPRVRAPLEKPAKVDEPSG